MPDLDSFSFGDSPELLALVLAGKKTATCWAASEGIKGVEVGKRWIVKDGRDRPRAIIETIELTRRRFGDFDAGFAHDEGEGDRTLAWWRRAHTNYFTRRGEFSPDMELYCERFRLVERRSTAHEPLAPDLSQGRGGPQPRPPASAAWRGSNGAAAGRRRAKNT